MDCSMPGLPIHQQLLEFTQTHVHWVGDAIQPSHPLSFPSPPALNLSQHQGLFQWVSYSHQVAKVLEFQFQHQSFQWTPGLISLGWTGWISLQSKRLSRIFSHTTVLSHVQLFVTPWTIQSMEFSRPEYWSGYPFPSPGDLPNPGTEPRSPSLQGDSLKEVN